VQGGGDDVGLDVILCVCVCVSVYNMRGRGRLGGADSSRRLIQFRWGAVLGPATGRHVMTCRRAPQSSGSTDDETEVEAGLDRQDAGLR
jgi:hypothetical protein